jgi:RNA polymerase sigma factor for flagellar operon FliA
VGELQYLWQRYGARPTPDVRRRLIEGYAPLARYVVDRMNLTPSAAVGYDDLLAQAIVGLIEAVDRYDPARGVKFETYAYHRIRGAVVDMLREMDWIPRSMRQREAELTAAYARLEECLGRPPTDEEMAQELGITVEGLDGLAQELALQTTHSLEEEVGSWDGDRTTVGDLVADQQSPSPEEEVERWAERELLGKAIDRLPEVERTVVSLYYHEGLTLKEIGQVLGVSESRVCQIHGKAVVRLRAELLREVGAASALSASEQAASTE